jgi:GT2 family glycosyltransferase
MPAEPCISVVMPVYDTPEHVLRETIGSVRAQTWPGWQLCIADDASPSPHVQAALADLAAQDSRILVTHRPVNGHIAAASNTALGMTTGDWVALLDHDDLLAPHALATIVQAIRDNPEAQILFSDEDKIGETGRRFDPYFKPGFDPDLLLGQNVISHLGVYRRELLLAIGGWREGFEGSQDYDLALRAVRTAGDDAVRHVPGVLYHWRQPWRMGSFSQTAIERCADAGRRAVSEHLRSRGVVGARVEAVPRVPFWNRVRWPVPAEPCRVALVLMPEAELSHSLGCVRDLVAASDHPVSEVIVPLAQDDLLGKPDAAAEVVMVAAGTGAGWARRINRAVAVASSEVIVVVGDRPQMAEQGWLSELVALLLRPGIGAVGGASLRTPTRLRHAELSVDADGQVVGVYPNARRSDVGYLGGLALVRRVMALGGACMAFRRSVFQELDGADDAALDGGLADADLCLRLRQRGLAVVWTPHAPLIDGGRPVSPDRAAATAAAAFHRRWGDGLLDPARSPLLGLQDGRPALPRR